MKVMLAMGCVAILAADADATCRQQRAVFAQVAVAPIVSTAFLPIAVPQYSAGYDNGLEVQKLQQELQEMKFLLKKLQSTGPAAPPAKTSGKNVGAGLAAYASVIKNKCAACHHATHAAAKGDGFVLSAGADHAPVKLTDRQISRMLIMTHNDTMPKRGDKLTDAEYGAIVDAAELLRKDAAEGGANDQSFSDELIEGAASYVSHGAAKAVVRQRVVAASVVTPFVPTVQAFAFVQPAAVIAPVVVAPPATFAFSAQVLAPPAAAFSFAAVPVRAAAVIGAGAFRARITAPAMKSRQVIRTRVR